MALSAYRAILRGAKIAFEGDTHNLSAAILHARSGFETHRDASDDAADAMIADANEVAVFLRKNLVQGKRTEGDKDLFKLRIHSEIERGDNDTIKLGRNRLMPSQQGKCCQS